MVVIVVAVAVAIVVVSVVVVVVEMVMLAVVVAAHIKTACFGYVFPALPVHSCHSFAAISTATSGRPPWYLACQARSQSKPQVACQALPPLSRKRWYHKVACMAWSILDTRQMQGLRQISGDVTLLVMKGEARTRSSCGHVQGLWAHRSALSRFV